MVGSTYVKVCNEKCFDNSWVWGTVVEEKLIKSCKIIANDEHQLMLEWKCGLNRIEKI